MPRPSSATWGPSQLRRVDVAEEVGINLSAQTGYDSSPKVSFHMETAHALCGTNGYPADSPSRLVAGENGS